MMIRLSLHKKKDINHTDEQAQQQTNKHNYSLIIIMYSMSVIINKKVTTTLFGLSLWWSGDHHTAMYNNLSCFS